VGQARVVLSGRYALEEEVARGGMSVVWRAKDQVLARTVAVKLLHPHLASDEAFLERFRTEALAAARLTHPNVVATYDTGSERTEDGVHRHFIVMEYCGGGTLADRLAAQGPMEADQVLRIGETIAGALAYAHSNEIVHRDIKPANILLTEDGTLKVGDFGIAKAATISGDVTTTGKILGTVAYLSPEQAEGAEPDARSDVYSLGCVLYELLTGRAPFVEDTQIAVAMKHLREPPPAPRSIRANIPRSAEQVVLKALAKDPDDRYASADEMQHALGSAAGGTGQTAVLRTMQETGRRQHAPARTGEPSFKLWPVLLVIGLGIALAIAIPMLLEQRDETNPPAGDNQDGGGSSEVIRISTAHDFDPEGDDQEEHPEDVPLAHDNDPSTAWETSSYDTPMSEQKAGVGLVFDLGDEVAVDEVLVLTSTPGVTFELRAAAEDGSTPEDFEEVEAISNAGDEERVAVDGHEARYWLVWITDLPGSGAGSAAISEVRFFGG
jgi:eukaryotic-like serine/threonine-protein kinase